MIKRNVGLIVTALIIGTMIVMSVKSNIDKTEPDEYFETTTTIDSSEKETGLKQGNVPPDFELTTLSGDVVRLSDYKGKKVILNFWASWCPPCKEEMPHMEKYYRKNKDSENVEIIAVNMTKAERPGSAREFVDAYGLTFPIPLDKTGEVMDAYKIGPLPMTYMINTDGTIAHQVSGPINEKLLNELGNNLQ
ncbi:redoxin domain-containing protein [Paenisporosarcina sp. OV554]|uniref:redoxin domain-containing protein n=1 Tax=Paenisporosarcina sp. OV554 TaxID=2135694 RepID=UPI000D3BA20E|nr:redoxin domain-containing protein [Paenisporosarcina sp. OV554]